MNKVSLNFIAKNEGHIVERMLRSTLPIIDMIVAIDTGSSDNTVKIIETFGQTHKIPTHVFRRPFDNFCNSRNYALDKLKEEAEKAGWELSSSWGFTVDCDEWVRFQPDFDKEDLYADFYVVRQRIGRETFTRHGMFKLSKPLYWESPIHETIVYSDPTIVKEYALNIEVVEEPEGASWKGDLEKKFLRYAEALTDYLQAGHENFRTVFFIGDSYHAAASYCIDPTRSQQLYEIAAEYFQKALPLETENQEVRFMLFKKIAENKRALQRSWSEIKADYLAAFLENPAKAETFAEIIEYYIDQKQWEIAYYYSVFCYAHFVVHPLPAPRHLYNDESLYEWRLLFCYYITSFKSGRRQEAKRLYRQLKILHRQKPASFTDEDLLLISIHIPLAMALGCWRERVFLLLSKHLATYFPNGRKFLKAPETKKRIHYAA